MLAQRGLISESGLRGTEVFFKFFILIIYEVLTRQFNPASGQTGSGSSSKELGYVSNLTGEKNQYVF